MKKYITLFVVLSTLTMGCQKELCRTCNTYNLESYQGELDNFYGTFLVCEQDDMWDEIVWWEECHGCFLPSNEGGSGSLIDLNIYKVGIRNIENPDIDGDGVHNNNDIDIDGDGVLNFEDYTAHGLDENIMLELIICTDN